MERAEEPNRRREDSAEIVSRSRILEHRHNPGANMVRDDGAQAIDGFPVMVRLGQVQGQIAQLVQSVDQISRALHRLEQLVVAGEFNVRGSAQAACARFPVGITARANPMTHPLTPLSVPIAADTSRDDALAPVRARFQRRRPWWQRLPDVLRGYSDARDSMARRPRTQRESMPAVAAGIRTIRQGEVRVAYNLIGESGPVTLLLQPFWVAIDDVQNESGTFGPQLAAGHRVIVHDRRGTGASDRHPGTISTKVQAADLVAILDDIGVSRVHVVAMTEAAPLAVQVAAQYPERVARLVLIDPHLRPRVGPGSTMLLHTLHSRPRAGLHAFARSLVSDDEAADALAERITSRMNAPTAARLYEAFLQADALALAPLVQARTLLAFGVHDRMVVAEEARELQSHFPAAQIGVVNGTLGTPAATREAWVQTQDFLAAGEALDALDEPEAPRRPAPAAVAPLGQTQPEPPDVGDYVPAGAPAQLRPLSPTRSSHAVQGPMIVRWGPPAVIPQEAVELNRKAVDHILLGEIEEALGLFQKAMEIAPEYEDAAINYRELLSRLVQRRVAQWQTQQAELMLSDAERKAARHAKRSKKFNVGRLFRANAA